MRNRTENQIELVLIRHGATKANEERQYLGRTDEELSEKGKEALRLKKEQLMYPDVDILYGSPMKRCRQTAELLYPQLDMIPVKEWIEIDFGAFEGKNYKELQTDERYQAFIDSNGMLPFPDGESREDFIKRCRAGFLKILLEDSCHGKKRVGIVVHGGTIMALLSSYTQKDYFDYQVATGEGYICTVKWSEAAIEITDVKKLGETEENKC